MKKLCMFLIFAVFLLSLVSAQNTETHYYIYQDKVLVEYYFESVTDLELRIPYDVDEPELDLNYELQDFGNYKILKIDSGEDFSIKYITESMIDKSNKKYYFTSQNYLGEAQKVQLVLPESVVLVEEGLVFPEPDLIESNGRNIILKWDNYNAEQIVVNYEFVKDSHLFWYVVILILVLSFIAYSIFQKRVFREKVIRIRKRAEKRKPKKHKKEDLTKNLFEEEKKIVEYLLDKKGNEAWTKEIMRDLNISKVKLSRKLRSLEQKEVVKKIPYGNENKIRVLKK